MPPRPPAPPRLARPLASPAPPACPARPPAPSLPSTPAVRSPDPSNPQRPTPWGRCMGAPKPYSPFSGPSSPELNVWFPFSFFTPTLYTDWLSSYSELLRPSLGSSALSDLSLRLFSSLALAASSACLSSPTSFWLPSVPLSFTPLKLHRSASALYDAVSFHLAAPVPCHSFFIRLSANSLMLAFLPSDSQCLDGPHRCHSLQCSCPPGDSLSCCWGWWPTQACDAFRFRPSSLLR